jgi:hypothetical protein
MRALLLFIATIAFTSETNDLIDKIKQNGKAIDVSEIASVKDPFFGESKSYLKGIKETNVTKYEPTFSLKAVFGDKALINDRWVAKGELLEGYTLVDIGAKDVRLEKDNERKSISIATKKMVW